MPSWRSLGLGWGVALWGAACGELGAGSTAPPADASAPPPLRSTSEVAAASPEGPSLRLMTYNVHVNLAGDDATLDAIEAPNADVVLLQETSPAWEEAIRARTAYPHVAFRHHDGAGGLAVLSRLPFADQGELDPPEGGWFPAWVLLAETPVGRVQLVNVHLRPQVSETGSIVAGVLTTAPVRRREIEAYFGAVAGDVPTVYAGDFNESLDGGALRFLEERGFESALPASGPASTWRWSTPLGTARAHLDHVVVERAAFEASEVAVLDLGRSDHLPVVVTLRPAQR